MPLALPGGSTDRLKNTEKMGTNGLAALPLAITGGYRFQAYSDRRAMVDSLEFIAAAPRTLVPRESFAYTSGRRRSGAAKLGWIIVGRGSVVVGPQTTRSGVVAVDPCTTRTDVAWDHSLAGTNDNMSRFGMMPSCGGVRRSTESDKKAQGEDRTHCIFSKLDTLQSVGHVSYVVRGPHRRNLQRLLDCSNRGDHGHAVDHPVPIASHQACRSRGVTLGLSAGRDPR